MLFLFIPVIVISQAVRGQPFIEFIFLEWSKAFNSGGQERGFDERDLQVDIVDCFKVQRFAASS